jgi:hypothetical protein
MDLNINLKNMRILVSLLLIIINLFMMDNKVSLEKFYLRVVKEGMYLM